MGREIGKGKGKGGGMGRERDKWKGGQKGKGGKEREGKEGKIMSKFWPPLNKILDPPLAMDVRHTL